MLAGNLNFVMKVKDQPSKEGKEKENRKDREMKERINMRQKKVHNIEENEEKKARRSTRTPQQSQVQKINCSLKPGFLTVLVFIISMSLNYATI